jgi:hypothetical protein
MLPSLRLKAGQTVEPGIGKPEEEVRCGHQECGEDAQALRHRAISIYQEGKRRRYLALGRLVRLRETPAGILMKEVI